jgi:hypothetical protein
MSATSASSSPSGSRRKAGHESKSKPESSESGPFRPALPMKPRPRLFMLLMGVLLLWCGVMVWMYVRAIHPNATPLQQQPPATTERGVAQADR